MIPVNEPFFGGNEKKYLAECIDTGWISSEGPFVQRFEKGLADYVGRKFATACSSGTAALDIAVSSLNLKEGDEVILPSFTIISCAQALVRKGVKPVFVDCDRRTFNMISSEIEPLITSKTKAIMIVHIFGLTIDVEPVLRIAEKFGLKVIEDAAQAIGLNYKNRKCGGIGDISIFSFYPNKQITTGEGGMVLSDDPAIDLRAKSLRNLCFTADRFVHTELGYNYRMTNMQAALGVAQLERIEEIVKRKREVGTFYNEALAGIPDIVLPLEKTDYCENIYWVYPLVLNTKSSKSVKHVTEKLRELSIGTRPFFYPLHKQPVFLEMGIETNRELHNSEFLYEFGFYIPSGLALTENQMGVVSDSIRKILK